MNGAENPGLTLKEQLLKGCEALGLEPDNDKIERLLQYLHLLNKWNKHYNLSGISDESLMVNLHLLDSLSLIPFVNGNRILDVGTGAGLPGIPLAIYFPEKHFVLLDSNGKKTRFLFQVKLELKLDNISIENCRIEHYQSEEQIDIVTSRAFSSLLHMVQQTRQLITADTKILAMKGSFPQQEIDALPTDFSVTAASQINLPGQDIQRHILEIRRV